MRAPWVPSLRRSLVNAEWRDGLLFAAITGSPAAAVVWLVERPALSELGIVASPFVATIAVGYALLVPALDPGEDGLQ